MAGGIGRHHRDVKSEYINRIGSLRTLRSERRALSANAFGYSRLLEYPQRRTVTTSMTDHTAKAFDIDLRAITRLVAEMGGWAERQVLGSVDALINRDRTSAAHFASRDATMDEFQHTIEKRAVATIAIRQPVAVDLRDIVGMLRIAGELVRVGGLAKNIAKRALSLNGEKMPLQASGKIREMADLAVMQLRNVLDSLARRDSGAAFNVWKRDSEIDAMYFSLFSEFLVFMQENSNGIVLGTHLLFCAKNLERMGDHASNMAEAVQYMIEGRRFSDIRPLSLPDDGAISASHRLVNVH